MRLPWPIIIYLLPVNSHIEDDVHSALLKISKELERAPWDDFISTHHEMIESDFNSQLCLILSKVPSQILKNGRVQLMLGELPFYTFPERQLRCVVEPPELDPTDMKDYMTFLSKLPIMTDPHLWHHILRAWQSIPGSIEKMALLNMVPGLSTSIMEKDLVEQFCALDKVHKSVQPDLITVLPVFTSPEGAKILGQAKKDKDLCKAHGPSYQSVIFHQVIKEAAEASRIIPKSKPFLPEFGLNEALNGSLHVDAFINLIHYNASTENHQMLFKLIDTSDISLAKIHSTDAILISSFLVNEHIPVELFKLFLERAGRVMKANHSNYVQFLEKVLEYAEDFFSQAIFYKWHMSLTLTEPSLVCTSDGFVSMWERLLDLNGTDIAQLTDALGGVVNLQFLEDSLEMTKCLTTQPVILPSSCGALKGLIEGLNLSGSKMLQAGHWRIASLILDKTDKIKKYLQKDALQVMPTAWVLSKLDRQKDVLEDQLFNKLKDSVKDKAVRLYLSLNESLVTAKKKDICRNDGKATRTIAKAVLKKTLDRVDGTGKRELSSEERHMIIKALICSLTGIHPDSLDAFVNPNQSTSQIFTNFIDGHCRKWEDSIPGFTVI